MGSLVEAQGLSTYSTSAQLPHGMWHPQPGIESLSPALKGEFSTTGLPGKSPGLYLRGGGLVAKSCPTLGTLWTVARQASLSMGFPRQDYWSGLPFPFPGDCPDPGIQPSSPTLQTGSLPAEPSGKPYLCKSPLIGFPVLCS